jgi:hypothetical protein
MKVILPDPKALKGDTVLVKDYRRRPAVWVNGTVQMTALSDLHQRRGVYRWSYEVLVSQQRDAASMRVLHVNGDDVRRVSTVDDD